MSTDLTQYHELYLSTSRELIDTLTQALQQLQTDPNNSESIDEFHRAAHSLKSQSLVMGYEQIGTVCRHMEAFFLLIKQKELSLNEQYIQMLNSIVGHIKRAIDDIDASEHEPDLTADIKTLSQHTNIKM